MVLIAVTVVSLRQTRVHVTDSTYSISLFAYHIQRLYSGKCCHVFSFVLLLKLCLHFCDILRFSLQNNGRLSMLISDESLYLKTN